MHGGDTFVKASGARAHFALAHQCDEKTFTVKRTADRAAEHDTGAIGAVLKIDSRGADRIASREPPQAITTRTADRRTEGEEILLNFANGHRPVAWRGKKAERFKPAGVGGDHLPDLIHVAAGRGHDPETSDDWMPRTH